MALDGQPNGRYQQSAFLPCACTSIGLERSKNASRCCPNRVYARDRTRSFGIFLQSATPEKLGIFHIFISPQPEAALQYHILK